MQNLYVEDRKKVQEAKQSKSNYFLIFVLFLIFFIFLESHIPITVRQLEAIIRLSEARAKLTLSSTVTLDHVEEAHRLFQVSTLNAISTGIESFKITVKINLHILICPFFS